MVSKMAETGTWAILTATVEVMATKSPLSGISVLG